MFGFRTVSEAFEKMNARYGRKAPQFFESEFQRPVHHAVKQKTIFAGIDVWNDRAAMGAYKVKGGGRDNPDRILQWRQDVKREAELIGRGPLEHGLANRGH